MHDKRTNRREQEELIGLFTIIIRHMEMTIREEERKKAVSICRISSKKVSWLRELHGQSVTSITSTQNSSIVNWWNGSVESPRSRGWVELNSNELSYCPPPPENKSQISCHSNLWIHWPFILCIFFLFFVFQSINLI